MKISLYITHFMTKNKALHIKKFILLAYFNNYSEYCSIFIGNIGVTVGL